MALTDCGECGKQVSTNAYTCPNCGSDFGASDRKRDAEWENFLLKLICIVVLSGSFYFFFGYLGL